MESLVPADSPESSMMVPSSLLKALNLSSISLVSLRLAISGMMMDNGTEETLGLWVVAGSKVVLCRNHR